MVDWLLMLMLEVRSAWVLMQLAEPTTYGSIAYEYEKNSYPLAMADVLANHSTDQALAWLQQIDPQATETHGIDLLSGFTLKGQMRKYFYFGDRLDPAYRQRMYQAMQDFTVTDPLTRVAQPPRKFWVRSQDDCTTPVDCRNTDNLRAMRETSVYLMAEETGNEATRLIYKQRLERYVTTLYDIGMGEWDSPVYHGHTTSAYLNLYDFAHDPEVKQLAQNALDWLFYAAALKYWRGSWTGPAKRTYGDSAARFFWLYFGDAPPPENRENDWIHALTSSYHPPEWILQVAHRQFPLPIEIRHTHPHYENWKPGLYGPAFYETLYIGHTFQLGSLAQGSGGDWSGFSLYVVKGMGTDQLQVKAEGISAIAQHHNLLIWQGIQAPELTYPAGEVETIAGITLIHCEQTWLAIHPLPQGFILEVGEPQTHGSYASFRQGVLARSHMQIQGSDVAYVDGQGRHLRMVFQGDALPLVWRDGVPHDWGHHQADSLARDLRE